VNTLAMKECAKTAWETLKTMRLRFERIRKFDSLRFKHDELI
jgi:hypothetical protein